MTHIKKTKVFIIDTSAILSGKPINIIGDMVTSSSVSDEFSPGGRSYRSFQFLVEKGLKVMFPSSESVNKINRKSVEIGEENRLSKADKDILALALDFLKLNNKEVIILTDDYSIQNIAVVFKIKFESVNQIGITKKFKWSYRCQGCGKKFKEHINICPICGAEIKTIISNKKTIDN